MEDALIARCLAHDWASEPGYQRVLERFRVHQLPPVTRRALIARIQLAYYNRFVATILVPWEKVTQVALLTSFQSFEAHDFAHDAEFTTGLAALQAKGTTPLDDEALEQARLYYYNAKVMPLDAQAYREWKRGTSIASLVLHDGKDPIPPNVLEAAHVAVSTIDPADTAGGKHKIPMDVLAEMVANNADIPRIREVPDTVRVDISIERETRPARRKPWERASESEATT